MKEKENPKKYLGLISYSLTGTEMLSKAQDHSIKPSSCSFKLQVCLAGLEYIFWLGVECQAQAECSARSFQADSENLF